MFTGWGKKGQYKTNRKRASTLQNAHMFVNSNGVQHRSSKCRLACVLKCNHIPSQPALKG